MNASISRTGETTMMSLMIRAVRGRHLGCCAALGLGLLAAPAWGETPARAPAPERAAAPPMTGIEEAGQASERPRQIVVTAAERKTSESESQPSGRAKPKRRGAGRAAEADAPIRTAKAAEGSRADGNEDGRQRRGKSAAMRRQIPSIDARQIERLVMREAQRYLGAWRGGAAWE
jgi:hypothetical protein